MVGVLCSGCARININRGMCLVVCMSRGVRVKTKTYLSSPSSLTVMGSLQVVRELGLKGVEPKLNLVEILDPQLLSKQH